MNQDLCIPGLIPFRSNEFNELAGSLDSTYEFTTEQVVYVVCGIDATATTTDPTQVQMDFSLSSTGSFYHDSQSEGEGLGVNFSWRGALPMFSFETLEIHGQIISGESPTLWACVAWGYLMPQQARPVL